MVKLVNYEVQCGALFWRALRNGFMATDCTHRAVGRCPRSSDTHALDMYGCDVAALQEMFQL